MGNEAVAAEIDARAITEHASSAVFHGLESEECLRFAQDSGHVASRHGEGKVVKGYGKGKRPFPPCY